MSSPLKYIDSSILIFSYKLMGAGFAFLVSVLFMQFSSSEMLGKYALSITIVTFLTVLVVFGQNVYLMRALTKQHTVETDVCLEKILAVCLFIYFCVAPFVFGLVFVIFPQAAFFFVILFTYYSASQLKSSIMLIAGRPVLNAWYDDFLRPFWSMLYIVIAMLVTYMSVDLEYAFVIASFVAAVPMIYSIKSMMKVFNVTFSRLCSAARGMRSDYVKCFFIQGWPVAIVGVLGLLVSQFDRIYVALLLGYSVAGIYYAAQTLVSVISYFNQALISKRITAMVRAYQLNEIGVLERLAKSNAWKSFGFSLIAIVGYIVFYPLVKLIFNVSIPEFFWVSMILLCMQSISLLFGFGSTMMLYSGEKGQQALIRYLLISFIVGTGLGSFFAFNFGIIGAAFGTGIGLLLNRILPFIYFRKLGYSLGVFGR